MAQSPYVSPGAQGRNLEQRIESVDRNVQKAFTDIYGRTQTEIDADATVTDHEFRVRESARYGDTGDGTTDDRDAIAAADSVGHPWITAGADYGTHVIGSDLTFTNRPTFYPGEILQPAAGVSITFSKFPVAHPSFQIFDLSVVQDGTKIVWPSYDRLEVPVAWFGAIPQADNDKSDQNVEINYAVDSLRILGSSNRGGALTFEHGDYFCSDRIYIKHNVAFRGVLNRGSNLRVSSNWNDNFDHLVLFQNDFDDGEQSMFNARIENMDISGGNDSFVDRVIWARAWNEHCGLRNVLVRDYMDTGLYISDYFGGSATNELEAVEFFASSSATASVQRAIFLEDPGYTVGWFQFLTRHLVTAGNATNGKTNHIGIAANGRVKLVFSGYHVEQSLCAMSLSDDASAYGDCVQATGNADCTDLIRVSSDWAGSIDVGGVDEGGVTGECVNSLKTSLTDLATSSRLKHKRVKYPFQSLLVNGDTDVILHAPRVAVSTTGGAIAADLADGEEGDRIYLIMTADSGSDAVITPDNFRDGSTLTFDDVNDDALLEFVAGSWKLITGSATVA